MIDFEFDYVDCVTMEDENGDYLYLDASAPAGSLAPYGYDSFVKQFAVCASDFNLAATYKWNSIEVRQVEISEGIERFAFTFFVEPAAGGDKIQAFTDVLFYEEDEPYASQLVEDYIEAGTEPTSLPFDDITNFVGAKIDGDSLNYTATLDASIYDVDDAGQPTGVIENTMHEVYTTTDDAYEMDVTLEHGDGEYGKYFAPAGHLVKGFANHEGNAYSYSKDGETNPATLSAEGKDIYEVAELKDETFASLSTASLWEGFFVTNINEEAEKHSVTYTIASSDSAAFVKKVLNLTYAGYYFLADLTQYQKESADTVFGYGETYITLQYDEGDANVVSMEFDYYGMLFKDTYFDFELVFDGFGSTAAVDLSEITWPTAS
jgi:hypothetical protein